MDTAARAAHDVAGVDGQLDVVGDVAHLQHANDLGVVLEAKPRERWQRAVLGAADHGCTG